MKIQEEKKVVRWKKPILACAVLLGAAMGLRATPVQPCSNYANYGALDPNTDTISCTIGDKTFSDFTYSNTPMGGAIPVTASDLKFQVIDNGTSAIGFHFVSVPLTATGASQTNDIDLGFIVTGPNIDDAAIGPPPYAMVGGAIGAGAAATIFESVCPNLKNCVSMATFNIANGPSQLTDGVTFAPVGIVSVSKDINVVGSANGFATISDFADTVSQGGSVPEPGFYGVLAGGIGAIIMVARRRKKSV
jgi:hypothetical protein